MRELRFSGLESTLGPWSLPKILGLWAQCLPQPSRLAVPSDSWALDHLKNLQEYGWAYPNLQHLRLLGGEWKPQLVELLANRRAESAVEAIETIVLENIHVGPQHLEAMKALVNEVVVETLE
ncbi:hypothetical protein FRC01_009938 [Tulasnella sp. 417]|nr:hypothetical protein FRC01_009938 [Tulasnella sp. 417]